MKSVAGGWIISQSSGRHCCRVRGQLRRAGVGGRGVGEPAQRHTASLTPVPKERNVCRGRDTSLRWRRIRMPREAAGRDCSLGRCRDEAALQRKSHLCIPRKGSARPQSQFSHSCAFEQFIYSRDWVHIFFLQQNRQTDSFYGNI